MKTRVLLVHNYYRTSAPSGEKQVLEMERDLLDSQGHVLGEYSRCNDEIIEKGLKGHLKGALSAPWNPFAAKAVVKEVDAFSPDIVHVHNTFPLLSPAIFHSIGSRAARVLTLHNYRLFCPKAIPMRVGNVCTECMQSHSVWPSIKHGCYRSSRLATLPVALKVALHRQLKTWINEVDAFIALSDFQRRLMIEAGLPEDNVFVKPHFFQGMPAVLPWVQRKSSVLFVGRLSQEKGVEFLIRAWMEWGSSAPELRIIGDGNLRRELQSLASSQPQVKIRFLGQLSRDATLEEIAQSSLLVFPSVCFETFGMVILEAFAHGTPVAASDIGPLPSIIQEGENGLIFPPANPHRLLEVVRNAWSSAGQLEFLGEGARESFLTKYTGPVNYELMMGIYQYALKVSQERKH